MVKTVEKTKKNKQKTKTWDRMAAGQTRPQSKLVSPGSLFFCFLDGFGLLPAGLFGFLFGFSGFLDGFDIRSFNTSTARVLALENA